MQIGCFDLQYIELTSIILRCDNGGSRISVRYHFALQRLEFNQKRREFNVIDQKMQPIPQQSNFKHHLHWMSIL